MAEIKHPLMPYHLVPTQAGFNRTLKRMKRIYDLQEMDPFFKRANAIIPALYMGSDLMVEFPMETQEDFAFTDNYLKVRVPVNPLGFEN